MTLKTIGKLAGAVLISAGLAGCIDATVDVEVTSDTTAKATMTQEMGADFYTMIKASAAEDETASSDDFCAEGELTENSDGSATCVITSEGAFADLTFGEDEEAVTFAPAGPNLVRVALPMEEMKGELGADETLDEETQQMIEAFFAGHAVTVRFSGVEVVESNMEISADKTTAEEVIPFLDLLNGTAELPDELYAVVRTR